MVYKILLLTVIMTGIVSGASADQMDTTKSEYQKRLQEIQDKNVADYLQLGKWAKEKKMFGPAKLYIKKALELKPDCPEAKEALSGEMSATLPNNYFDMVKECRQKISQLEQKCAARLGEIAKYCKDKKLDDEKEFCFNEALKYDPNHKWIHEERDEVKVENFGWVSKSNADKIKSGLREFKGEWLSQKEVEKLRSNWDNAWELRSPHYLLRTDIPLAKAQANIKKLDEFYEAFLNIFYGVDGFSLPSNHVLPVYYFKDKSEFHAHAEQCHPPEKDNKGYHASHDNAAHLWQWESAQTLQEKARRGIGGNEEQTLLHECMHQLVSSATSPPNAHGTPHFWIIEGIACYSETFKIDKGKVSFGNLTAKMYGAKQNIAAGTYMHLKEFAQLNKKDFTGNSCHYNQAVSLVLFFMQHDKYKLRFLEYVIAVHLTRGDLKDSLAEFMKIDNLDNVEKEWLEFVKKKM